MAILTAVCRDLKAEDVLYDEREVPKSEFKDAVDQFKVRVHLICEAKRATETHLNYLAPNLMRRQLVRLSCRQCVQNPCFILDISCTL